MSVQGDILRKCFIKGLLFIMQTGHFSSTNAYLQMYQKQSVKAPVHVPISLSRSGEWCKKAPVGKRKATLSVWVRDPMQIIPIMSCWAHWCLSQVSWEQDLPATLGPSPCIPTWAFCSLTRAGFSQSPLKFQLLDARKHDLFFSEIQILCACDS